MAIPELSKHGLSCPNWEDRPKPQPMTVHFEHITHDDKGLEWDEHGRLVGYIAVAPDDHAEMVRKAGLYNDLKAVIDRLDCEIQDIKARFV